MEKIKNIIPYRLHIQQKKNKIKLCSHITIHIHILS